MNIKHLLLGAGILLASSSHLEANAQAVKHERLMSFEDNIPEQITSKDSKLTITNRHYRDGQHSLEWKFNPGAILTLKKDLHFEKKDPTGKDTYLSAFIVWVYNETPTDNDIEFQFLKDGNLCSSFPMHINFKGWRGIWVCYERDMKGTPQEGMNEMRVIAPNIKGKLYFDHLITGSKVDARQQTPDLQVPFVNEGTSNHWLVIYKHSLLKPDIALTQLSKGDIKEMNLIEKRFKDMIYSPSRLSSKRMENLRERYKFYHIKYADNQVSGDPIFFVRHSEAYERMIPNWHKDLFPRMKMDLHTYLDLMKDIAVAYNDAENLKDKRELKDMFLAMYDNITDQGVAYGSCWGNIHHYGYSMRGLYVAYFLMKDVLRQYGQLEAAEKTLRWYAITNEVYPKPKVDGIDIDSFNTQTTGRIASILIMEDTPEKMQYLRSFVRWIDYGCRPALGLMGSFKNDGACFHHCNNYPAYAVGGLKGATNMIYLFSGTSLRISEYSHQTVKNVLLTMRFYCNLKQWPLSMSGRHPNGKGKLIPSEFAVLALAGSPNGKQKIDKDMAEAFLRLTKYDFLERSRKEPDYLPVASKSEIEKYRKEFLEKGFTAEDNPQGNLALGYGCISVQRRDNWAAVIRGHSRYLWAAEHYLPANFFGRYLAHGSMQILTGKKEQMVTLATSGWQENGFDWNRIPGVTSIHLPFDKLRAKVLNVDTFSGMEEMLYSDEAFAGGLSQEKWNGNFGMKLHEHDKYNGTLRARKSYHLINDMIVALGTDIENTNKEYRTETTVFQLAAVNKDMGNYWNNFKQQGRSFIDYNNVGYLIGKQSVENIKFEKNFPQITVGERSTKPTKGNWVNLSLQHGKSPKGGKYEYAVFPNTSKEQLIIFERKSPYKVLQQDRNAHIVYIEKEGITSYVLFEKPQHLPKGLVLAADSSCLIMTKKISKEKIILTVSQPDLALYRGDSDEAYDENGKRIERSIYSRPWISNPSGMIPLTITIKGKWKATSNDEYTIVGYEKGNTLIRFNCKDAKSYDVTLSRR